MINWVDAPQFIDIASLEMNDLHLCMVLIHAIRFSGKYDVLPVGVCESLNAKREKELCRRYLNQIPQT